MTASKHGAPAYLLDTGVLIAAQSPDDAHHEASAALVRAGQAGLARLLAGVGVDYDLETASAARQAERLAWLSNHGITIAHVPGPFTTGVSRLDSGDVLVSIEDSERMARLSTILGTPLVEGDEESWRRRQIDLHHANSALLVGAGLVTTDYKHLLRLRDEIREATALVVLAPVEAVESL
jgi:predicted nucleic acid-binding protein